MKVKDLISLGNKTMHKDKTYLLLSTLLNINSLEILLHLEDNVQEKIVDKFKECINSIKLGLPIQYALKNVNFYGYDFYVDKRVLIPRFETEELVYNTSLYIKKYFQDKIEVLDLCTGSGCIGLTLKNINPNLNITLSDISKEALEVANINKNKLNLDVSIKQSDLFNNIFQRFDVIVCNPPYISKNDEVDEIVLKNEPLLALYADNNGLEFYEKILSTCENYLNNKYLIAFEIGFNQKNSIIDLINKYLNNVKIITKQDVYKRDRMIFIFKNINIDE